jgi:hypothetical protein
LVNLATAAALCAQSRASWYRRMSASLTPAPFTWGVSPTGSARNWLPG